MYFPLSVLKQPGWRARPGRPWVPARKKCTTFVQLASSSGRRSIVMATTLFSFMAIRIGPETLSSKLVELALQAAQPVVDDYAVLWFSHRSFSAYALPMECLSLKTRPDLLGTALCGSAISLSLSLNSP
jgi:hypothetical protein